MDTTEPITGETLYTPFFQETVEFLLNRKKYLNQTYWERLRGDNYRERITAAYEGLNLGEKQAKLGVVGIVENSVGLLSNVLERSINNISWHPQYDKFIQNYEIDPFDPRAARDFLLSSLSRPGIVDRALNAIVRDALVSTDPEEDETTGPSLLAALYERPNDVNILIPDLGHISANIVYELLVGEFTRLRNLPFYRPKEGKGIDVSVIYDYNAVLENAQNAAFLALLKAWQYLDPLEPNTIEQTSHTPLPPASE